MFCSRCYAEHDRQGQRLCCECHAQNMRKWRRTHPLNDQQRYKANCRSYAGVNKRRGLLVQKPCEVCGRRSEMHHDDYDKPLQVRWLYRPCHLDHHREEKLQERLEVQTKIRELTEWLRAS